MAATSSSSSAQPLFAVWLYDVNFTRVKLIDVPLTSNNLNIQSIPPIVTDPVTGKYYVWSMVHFGYREESVYVAVADAGAPLLSPLCNPQN